MDLSDEELMLLEQLTYLEDIVFDAAGLDRKELDSFRTVAKIINYFDDPVALNNLACTDIIYHENDPKNPDDQTPSQFLQGYEWAALINEIKNNDKLMSLSIYQTDLYQDESKDITFQEGVSPRDPKTRIDTMVFCRTDEAGHYLFDEAIICFDGTLGPNEWRDNFKLLLGGNTECNEGAQIFLDSLPFQSYTTVGHSKGANKAAYLYYLNDKVKYCVAMDCPGFTREFYDDESVREGIEKARNNNSLKQYAAAGDFVNILLCELMGAEYHYCQGYGQAGFAENHSPITFFNCYSVSDGYLSEGRMARNPDGSLLTFTEQMDVMQKLHGFTMFVYDYMSPEEKEKAVTFLGNLIVVAFLDPDTQCEIDGNIYKEGEALRYALSDKETFSTIIAYFMVYADSCDLNWDDIKECVPSWVPILSNLFLGIDPKWFMNEFIEGFDKGKFSYKFWLNWLEVEMFADILVPGVTKEDLDEVLSLARDKAPGIERDTSSFFPNTSIEAPRDDVTPVLPITLEKPDDIGIGTLKPQSITPNPSTPAFPGLITGCFQKTDEDTLYMNYDAFISRKNEMRNAADKLVFNRDAFTRENEVCGTESLRMFAERWHRSADIMDKYREFMIGPMDKALDTVGKSIMDTDSVTSSCLVVNMPK